MFRSLIEAFLLGLVAGAVPGPILTGTFTEILKSGFLRGLRIIFYALIAETIGAINDGVIGFYILPVSAYFT